MSELTFSKASGGGSSFQGAHVSEITRTYSFGRVEHRDATHRPNEGDVTRTPYPALMRVKQGSETMTGYKGSNRATHSKSASTTLSEAE